MSSTKPSLKDRITYAFENTLSAGTIALIGWLAVASLLIVILAGIAAGTIAEIAKAIARRGTSSSELTALKQQVERYAASLDDAHASLADQAAQLAELQERVDFAERLLAQGRDRSALGAGSKRE